MELRKTVPRLSQTAVPTHLPLVTLPISTGTIVTPVDWCTTKGAARYVLKYVIKAMT